MPATTKAMKTPKTTAPVQILMLAVTYLVTTLLRLIMGGSSLRFFTNWAAILHVVLMGLLYYQFQQPLILTIGLFLSMFVAILSTVVFIWGSGVYRQVSEEYSWPIVMAVNAWVHYFPLFPYLYLRLFQIKKAEMSGVIWCLTLVMAYSLFFDMQNTYETACPFAGALVTAGLASTFSLML